ncbi:hypothetical protein DCAR_0205424 [Daucus carota subsp. sativus]|uniref:Uncharacterized protein n=1 Tax=Daucus carota subsp. sativus TaxID=79200 RepID=A0A162APN4_DAUCS|nr:hypothetical protein DCAR_0205424 [Daucus carota subsp. sativus]
MNSVAVYLADYGMHHLSEVVETTGDSTFGNMQYLLDRDMGMVFTNPEVEVIQDIGLGEVIDSAPPIIHRKRLRNGSFLDSGVANLYDYHEFGFGSVHGYSHGVAGPSQPVMVGKGKGKNKEYEEFAFWDNGVLSTRAIEILESGALTHYSPAFYDRYLDLEAHVSNGFLVKDILHHACLGTLELISFMLVGNHAPNLAELMPMDNVSPGMGLGTVPEQAVMVAEDVLANKRARRASSI